MTPIPEDKLKKEMNEDYKLIPMSEITDEARLLAVAWVEGYERKGMDIPGKQKLASDIMNYARRNASTQLEAAKKEIEGLRNVISKMFADKVDEGRESQKEIERLKIACDQFKELRKLFIKGSPLTNIMDKIITENNL